MPRVQTFPHRLCHPFAPRACSGRPAAPRRRWLHRPPWLPRHRLLTHCAALLALLLVVPEVALAYGELVVLQGTATVTRKGHILRRSTGQRLDLLAGDRIETLWGSKAYLTLFWDTAGGEAMLDASSVLQVNSARNPDATTPIVLQQGSLRARDFLALGNGPLIDTGAGFVSASGADFVVTTYGPQRSEFICIRGRIEVVSHSDPTQRLVLQARQRAEIVAGFTPEDPTQVGDVSWYALLDSLNFLEAR
ncbi:MAG: hypothetical protein HY342_11390 [Candidatus Lambdaproteobacteria bacterium]|nr:hypothetical protein [Candidatus Lambdaproteobacteria bacterium]